MKHKQKLDEAVKRMQAIRKAAQEEARKAREENEKKEQATQAQ